MTVFTRDDGKEVRVIEGLRKQVLATPRISVQPKPEWTDAEYRAAAEKKIRHSRQFLDEFSRLGGTLEGARVLEVGCGAAIDCLLLALQPIHSVVGIDLDLPLFDAGERGERTRRLTREVLRLGKCAEGIDSLLRRKTIRIERMDATQMSFRDESFDLLRSRAAMEHITPPEKALAEMARVVRPGGLIRHDIDPFYWLKGCHKGGVVDIPWAHARLTASEYRRFVAAWEGEEKAAERSKHLLTLNQFTPREWRRVLQAGPFEILQWKEETWPPAEMLLDEHPEIHETLLQGVAPADLTCRSIKVWLRNKGGIAH